MLFHSIEFNILLIITLAIFYAFPKARLATLTVANAVFYGVTGIKYLLLFIVVTYATYWLSLHVKGRWGRQAMTLGIILNLLNLGYFKYTGMLVNTLNKIAHLGIDPKPWQLVLPVGISFYAFECIAYLVDVYRGRTQPARNFLEYWGFIAFFGHMLAGPIMRGHDFLPQIEQQDKIRFRQQQFKRGIFTFVLGMTKKVVFADPLGAKADAFFGQALSLGSIEAWIAAYIFAFQIYFDFSAYSDMAVGVGDMFGLTLFNNFRTPYLAANPGEFWKRWHITLSSWIKDYIYIPLGGSRRGEFRSYVNSFVAMALSGLWHGANWTFVVWGVVHGGLSAGHKFYSRYIYPKTGIPANNRLVRWVSIFITFQATTVAWVFFRANGISTALHMVKRMLLLDSVHLTRTNVLYLLIVVGLFAAHWVEYLFREHQSHLYQGWVRLVPAPVRALAYAGVVAFLLLMTQSQQASFIYFRF